MPPVPQQVHATTDALLAHALTATATAIFITDQHGTVIWVNDAFSLLCGYAREEVIGAMPSILRSGRQSDTFYAHLWQTLNSGDVWQGEIVDRRRDGSLYIVDEIITPLFDQDGAVTHFIAIQHDVTRRKEEGEHDHQLAYQDFLTGLPNRASFFSFHQRAVEQAAGSRQVLATLFLDLDNFKPVNDMLGHSAGDELLVAVAERLRRAVRQADLVSRVGGDEFAIVLVDLPGLDVARQLAQKLVDAIAQPFVVQGRKINIGVSIGVAAFPQDGQEPEALLTRADKAMYRAKCLGGSNFQFYAPNMDSAGP